MYIPIYLQTQEKYVKRLPTYLTNMPQYVLFNQIYYCIQNLIRHQQNVATNIPNLDIERYDKRNPLIRKCGENSNKYILIMTYSPNPRLQQP